MAELYTIDGAHITIVRSGGDDGTPQVELVEKADHGEVGGGQIQLDDTAGTLATVGHKAIIVTQDNCSVPRTFTGYVGQRQIQRGTDKTESKRLIDLTTLDLNARLAFRVIHGTGSRRPREGIDDRLTWLLGSSALTGLVADYGFVDYPTTVVDKNDYRGQFPSDVLRDLALVAGYNFFAYWSAADNAAGLWFNDSNTSTDFSSTLRFSSVSTDVDSSTTFAAGGRAELTRDPAEVISGVWMPYARGNVYRTRAATEDTFEPRDGVAPSSNVKTRTRARTIGDRYLFARRNEEDSITDTWTLPDTAINLVRAGQRVQARYAQFDTEGYGEFSWFRILETRKRPLVTDAGVYSCGVTLSPQEAGCSVTPTFVQYNGEEMDPNFGTNPQWTWRAFVNQDHTTASTPGNLIVLAFAGDGLNVGTLVEVPDGWSSTFVNLNMKADDSSTWCHFIYKKSEGESYVDVQMTGSVRGPTYLFMEYAGLTNPVQSGSYSINRQEGLGYATAAATSWPAGATLVLNVCYMLAGPESGDALEMSGTGLTLRTPQDSGGNPPGYPAFFAGPCIGIGDMFRSPSDASGTSPVYPAAGGWYVGFTNDEPTMVTGIAFVGDNC